MSIFKAITFESLAWVQIRFIYFDVIIKLFVNSFFIFIFKLKVELGLASYAVRTFRAFSIKCSVHIHNIGKWYIT